MGRKQLRRGVGKPLPCGSGPDAALGMNDSSAWWKWLCRCCLLALALSAGLLHRHHVAYIHENMAHFSHLSTLERELLFRTEMGFYYSFFKQLITAPSVRTGLATLLADNTTEFPSEINALRRFNLYPELGLALLYRSFSWIADRLGWATQTCYMVDRGSDLPQVQSCEGIGEPACFYVECVFALSGLLLACVFLLGCEVAEGRLWGGALATAAYFFNHRECTRVQWTPPLRESFSYPLFMTQQLLLVRMLRRRPPSGCGMGVAWWTLTVATVAFMLPWQFAQFALLTQSLSLFVAHMLGYLPARFFRHIAYALLTALGMAFVLQCGNMMLLTSFYSAALITMIGLAHGERFFHSLGHPLLAWSAQAALLTGGTYAMKQASAYLFLAGQDDAHISQLLISKFTSFRNFDTLLYSCAPEFDFMQMDTLRQLSYTLLLPAALLASMLAFVRLLVDAYHKMRSVVVFQVSHRGPQQQQPTAHANGTENLESRNEDAGSVTGDGDGTSALQQHKMEMLYLRGADVVFLLCQLGAFTVMAVLIMRLKLFWTPQLCLTCALLARSGWLRIRNKGHSALLALLLAGMAVKGWQNLQAEWNVKGEFSNWPMEELVNWIREHTRPGDSFGGSMPTMATVRLTTGRPIVNHPHYEDEELRMRTRLIYSLYSRKSAEEVWRLYRRLQVRYVILEPGWCYRASRPGCSIPEMWDLEDVGNRGQRPFCDRLLLNEGGQQVDTYFRKVFENKNFKVYRVWPGGGPVIP